MKKTWMKTSAVYSLTGAGHEKGLNHTYANVIEDVKPDQINQFGAILAELSGDSFKKATVNTSDVLVAE